MLVELNKGHSFDQTFLSTEPYLNSISFPVDIRDAKDIPQSTISICLSEMPSFSPEIKCKDFLFPHDTDVGEIVFSFPAQPDSLNKFYLISIQTDAPSGVIFFQSSSSNSYPDGDLYINGRKTSRDLAFFASSRPNLTTLIESLTNSMHRLLLMVEFFTLYLICGYLILTLFTIDLTDTGIIQRLILYNSVGLAFPPIVLYSFGLFNIHLTRNIIIWASLFIVGLFFLVFTTRSIIHVKNTNTKNYQPRIVNLTKTLPKFTMDQYDLMFFCLFVLALITRLLQVKDLLVPNWIDGLVHQNILEGLFTKGAVPVDQIYHTGFHLNAFFMQSLLRLDSPEATLIYGQWLSVASGTTFYFLAQKIFRSKFVSLICLAFYWFLSPFPSYLISWGRYPFLMGLTLLPVAITVSLEWLKSRKTNLFILEVLLAASLLLTHYSIVVIWGIFLIAITVNGMMENKRKVLYRGPHSLSMPRMIIQICLLFLFLGLFLYPKATTLLKFSEICRDPLPHIGACVRQLAGPSHIYDGVMAIPNETFIKDHGNINNLIDLTNTVEVDANTKYVFYLTLKYGGTLIWVGGLLGMVFLFRVNRRVFYVIVGWMLLLFLTSGLQAQLLGTAVPNTINTIIFLSMLLTLLCGFTIQHFLETKEYAGHLRNIGLAGLIGLILMGAYGSIGIVNPITTLFNREDQDAIAWINRNTSANDIVLINSFLWSGQYTPSDGGGWIGPLTGRNTVFPSSKEEFTSIQAIIDIKKVRYVYLGRGYGQLKPSAFQNSDFKLVYQSGGINIYKVLVHPTQ